ncbi:hypothetical protein BDW75DRAFT_233167 [Aspergillus navahoensis]
MDPKLFSNRVYLVTGGQRGIGLAVVRQLLEYGAYVYVQDLPPTASAELVALASEQLQYSQTDVRDRAGCRALIAAIVEKHKRLDRVVNNAGICPLEGELPSDEIYDEVIDINLNGVWNVGTAALAQMQKQGFGSLSLVPAYSATKHAILGLTRTWALDFAQYGVRVNCIAPGGNPALSFRCLLLTGLTGPTDTDMSIPLKRIGRPAEVASPINFLLSDLASFITGQILCVSGGQ